MNLNKTLHHDHTFTSVISFEVSTRVCKPVPKNPGYKTTTSYPIQGHPWPYEVTTCTVLHFKIQGYLLFNRLFFFMAYSESYKYLYFIRILMVDIQTQIKIEWFEIELQSWIVLLGLSFNVKDQKDIFTRYLCNFLDIITYL